jgi:hypothetical protein
MIIPKLIHITWVQGKPPERLQKNVLTWREYNPDYTIMHWDESRFFSELAADRMDNSEFVLPNELLDYYRGTGVYAIKAEIIKLYFMRKYGGVYADMDTEAVKGITDALGDNLTKPMICGMTWKPKTLQWLYFIGDGMFLMTPKDTGIWNMAIDNAVGNIRKKKPFPVITATTSIYDDKKIRDKFGIELCLKCTIVLDKKDIKEHTVAIHQCDASWYGESFLADIALWSRTSDSIDPICILLIIIIAVVIVVAIIMACKRKSRAIYTNGNTNEYS